VTTEIGRPYQVMEPKRSYHRLDYGIDWSDFLARVWRPGTAYTAGQRVRPPAPTGFEYECTTPGQSGARVPQWPTTAAAASRRDGEVVWTARSLSEASLVTAIATSEWTADDGLELTSPGLAGPLAMVIIGGGTSGQRYSVYNRVQLANGHRAEAKLVIPVQD
jgi:hypothetical protein